MKRFKEYLKEAVTNLFNRKYAKELLDNPSGSDFNEKMAQHLTSLAAWSKHGGWLPETDATEHLYGSSGRGHEGAKRALRHLSDFNLLHRTKVGKATYYHAPKEIHDLVTNHPKWKEDPGFFHNIEQELGWMEDGSRPKPRPAPGKKTK